MRRVRVCVISGGLSGQDAADFRDGEAAIFMEVDDTTKASIRAEQKDARCVVHGVVAVVGRYLFELCAEICGNAGQLIKCAGEAGNARVEI